MYTCLKCIYDKRSISTNWPNNSRLNIFYLYNMCLLIRKTLNKSTHRNISFTKQSQVQERLLRHANNICLQPPRTVYHGRKGIKYEGAQLYNKLPNDIKK